MSLKQWADNRWLRSHQTSAKEIGDLLRIVDRDLEDAKKDISADWQFGIAYNAALKLCTILLYAEGYKPEKNLAHYRTLEALSLILGSEYQDDVDYLQACRVKRNEVEYDSVGGATTKDAKELSEFVIELRSNVLSWLKKNHPKLYR